MLVTSSAKLNKRKYVTYNFIIIISIIALFLRLLPLRSTWLWSDEIFSISLAEAGFVQALLGTIRHDLHPPVYYLQLVPWAAVFKSDAGLLLNSVMWDMARLTITMTALYRIAGINAALIGGVAGTFLGSSLYSAENLRMYAMMGFAIVAAWFFTEKIFKSLKNPSWRDGLVLLVLQIMIIGSHGAGPFFVFFVVLHGAIMWLQFKGSWRKRLPWLCAQIVTGIVSLVVIANGAVRATEHYRIDWTWQEIFTPLAFMSAGTSLFSSSKVGIIIAATLTCMIVCLGLVIHGSRKATLIYVLAPIALSIFISATVKPIYGFRVLTCAAVFLPVILGLSFAEMRQISNRAGIVITGIFIFIIVSLGVHQRIFYKKDHNYPELASYIKDNIQPSDVILQYHQPATAWALGRYLIGPGWGDVMSVQHPDNEKWDKLFDRLGTRVSYVLKAKTDRMWYGENEVGLGEHAANELVPKAERVWIVATFVYDAGAVPEIMRSYSPAECRDFQGVFLCRYDMEAS